MGCRGGRHNGAGDGRNAWNGDFASEGGVAQYLGCSVEVAKRVCGDYHDRFLGITVLGRGMGWVVRGGGEGVGEEELGEFALAKRDDGGLLRVSKRDRGDCIGDSLWRHRGSRFASGGIDLDTSSSR